MSEEDVDRRKRLKALRERAEKSKGQTKEVSSTPTLKFRNYRPQDETIRERNPGSTTTKPKAQSGEKDRDGVLHLPGVVPSPGRMKGEPNGGGGGAADSGAADGTEEGTSRPSDDNLIQQELRKQKKAQDEDELNIAPRKVNWDLKRDIEKKLRKLDRRTQRAIVEIIRERMDEEAQNASSGDDEEEDEGDDDGDGSGSSDSSDSEDS